MSEQYQASRPPPLEAILANYSDRSASTRNEPVILQVLRYRTSKGDYANEHPPVHLNHYFNNLETNLDLINGLTQ